MGFYSWLTSDKNESIANVYSSKPVRTVYLLQPSVDGKKTPPIKEISYEGYGNFGGMNAYAWLAERNFGDASLVKVAINADGGQYYSDQDAIYLCGMHLNEKEFRKVVATDRRIVIFSNYEQVMACGKTPNQLIAKGAWFSNKLELKYPLKFSFDPDAVYEDLPAAEHCPHQGFFYPD